MADTNTPPTELETATLALAAAKETIAQQANQIASLKADLETAAALIDELKMTQTKPALSLALPEIKLGKAVYELTEPEFNWKGTLVNANVLNADADLVAELISEGVSFLRKK